MSDSFLRRPAVEALTGLSRAWIYAAMQRGDFPRPVRIGRRAVAWPKSAVDAWIEDRMAARETVPSGQAPGLVRHLRDRAGTG